MPIISLLKRKAKKYLQESIDYIQDGIDASKDYPETSNTFRINTSPGRNLEVIVHPNIQRSFSAIDISRGTQTNFVQIPKIVSNHQRINPCLVTNQCRGTNSFPHAQNTNFILLNPIVRPSNFNQTPRISPRNVSQRLIENDEILARRLQQEFDKENRSRVRQSSNNISNNPNRPTVNIINYHLANRQTHRPYQQSQTNRNIIMNQNQQHNPQTLIEKNNSKNCLKKEEIESLPSFPFRGNNQYQQENQCSICYEDFTKDVLLTCLICLHKFHSTCINDWLKQSRKCPLCNRDAIHGN